MGLAEKLWDIEQIKQLKARYFRYLDTKDWERYRTVFADDVKIYVRDQIEGSEPSFSGADEFLKWVLNRHDRGKSVTVHHGHMPEVELIDDTHARGIWAMFDYVDRSPEEVFVGYGHYYEEYEKGSDGKWRIKTFRLVRLRVDNLEPGETVAPFIERPASVAPWR